MKPTCPIIALASVLLVLSSNHSHAQTGGAKINRAPAPAAPAGVIAHRDLPYVTNGHERQKLDLYVSEKAGSPQPLIIWIHGGGWASGSKEGCPPLREGFIARGYAVASLNYRLSGDAVFPAQIEDCKAAIRWLRAHAKDYHLDPDHIGVWGSSAGGHLVALLGTSGEVSQFDVGENLQFPSRVQAVADWFGPTDLTRMDAHAIPGARLKHDDANSPESRLIGGAIQDKSNAAKVQRANPIAYVTKDDAPFLIAHGDADPTVPHHQSELLYTALVKSGVPVHFITVKGGGHGSGFPGPALSATATEFFDRHLMGKADSAKWPDAMTSEVAAMSDPGKPGNGAGPRLTFEQVCAREDSNGDGRVLRAEFKGPAAIFDKFDKNSDGVLTKDDFAEAPAPGLK